jgi:hypothetical protein
MRPIHQRRQRAALTATDPTMHRLARHEPDEALITLVSTLVGD